MLNDGLEIEFERLHGIKWVDAKFSVRACWTDAWLTATAKEREACANVCEEEICACCWNDDAQGAAEHLASTIRERSNVPGKGLAAAGDDKGDR